MSELTNKLEGARDALHPRWSADELELLLLGAHKKQRRRAQLRAGALVVGAVLASAGFWLVQHERGLARRASQQLVAGTRKGAPSAAGLPGPQGLHFADGSVVVPISSGTQLVMREVAETRIQLQLASGKARFKVSKRPQRTFSVQAGPVEVSVLGTEFTVERDPTRVGVKVTEGRVHVAAPRGTAELAAGETRWFSTEPPAAAAATPASRPAGAEDTPEAPAPEPGRRAARHARPHHRSWRDLARRGHYAEAFQLLRAAATDVRDEPQDLFLAADSARLSGHPAEAVPYLRKLVTRYGSDTRAPLASFTLGRVLLTLGRPAEAAAAFQTTQKLGSSGVLAEDALAREAESWLKAGDRVRARQRFDEYRRRHPGGHHTEALQRLLPSDREK